MGSNPYDKNESKFRNIEYMVVHHHTDYEIIETVINSDKNTASVGAEIDVALVYTCFTHWYTKLKNTQKT